MLVSADITSVHIGHLRFNDSVSIESCKIESERELTLTTRSVQSSPPEILVRLENPVLTLTVIARQHTPQSCDESTAAATKLDDDPETSAQAQALELLQAPTRDISAARSWQFRPPPEPTVWKIILPKRSEMIERAGFGEGVMTVEVSSTNGVFTDDGVEVDLMAPPSVWKGLFIDRGVASRKGAGPGDSPDPVGSKWTSLPFKPPRGHEIKSPDLRSALAGGKTEFTRNELDQMRQIVRKRKVNLEVESDSFIEVDGLFFEPLASGDESMSTSGDFLSTPNPEVIAGEAIEIVFSEVLLTGDPDVERPSKEAPGDGNAGLASGSSFLHNPESEVNGIDESYDISGRLRPPHELGSTKLRGAPSVWMSRGLRWVLTRKPDSVDAQPVHVQSGELSMDGNFRFILSTDRLTTLGAYELIVLPAGDDAPITLLDYSYATVSSIHFTVIPALVSQLGAKVSCAAQIANGSILDVAVELQACDKYGNPVGIDPNSCVLEVTSLRTNSAVARLPLERGGGHQQHMAVCVVEPGTSDQAWNKVCLANDGDPSSTVSLLTMRVVHVDPAGECSFIGQLEPMVKVVKNESESLMATEHLDDGTLGLTQSRISKRDDFGARAYAAAQKLRAEVQSGVVRCVRSSRRWPSEDDEEQTMPLTRYFHVVNVHVPGDNGQLLMEFARTKSRPYYSHDPRLGLISSKFAPHLFEAQRSRWGGIRGGVEKLLLKDAALMIQAAWKRSRQPASTHASRSPSVRGGRAVSRKVPPTP